MTEGQGLQPDQAREKLTRMLHRAREKLTRMLHQKTNPHVAPEKLTRMLHQL